MAGLIFGFVQGYSVLKNQADELNKAVIDAKASENSVTRMKDLEVRLSQLKDVEILANKMAAPLNSFQYQEQSIQTLNGYAHQAGVSIAQITFSPKTTGIGGASGSDKVIISVSLQNPVGYANFLTFMRLVESGLSQMQILQVQINQDKDGAVAVGPLSIAIYVK